MYATLYAPHQSPQPISVEGLTLPDPLSGLASIPERVPVLLDCTLELVDVLVSNPNYVAYSIFDCEGQVNDAAMTALTELTGAKFGDDEDEILRGTILVVHT
ncbi:MAG: hypothetical protein EOO61_01805 [Hymenobacter sp.]|nr:MAG: hypothetical protein EOO61_01805 [Hymenobacter sp.]